MWWLVAALTALGRDISEGICWWVTAQSSGTEQSTATGAGAVLQCEIPGEKELCAGFPWGDSKISSSEGGNSGTRLGAQGCVCGSRMGG